jgi:hypothetical protein
MKESNPGSHWNHRVVRAKDSEGETYLSFREVYYNSAGEVCAMTEEPTDICWSDNIEIFKRIINKAMNAPILDMRKIKYAKFDLEQVRRVRKGNNGSAKTATSDKRSASSVKAKRRS